MSQPTVEQLNQQIDAMALGMEKMSNQITVLKDIVARKDITISNLDELVKQAKKQSSELVTVGLNKELQVLSLQTTIAQKNIEINVLETHNSRHQRVNLERKQALNNAIFQLGVQADEHSAAIEEKDKIINDLTNENIAINQRCEKVVVLCREETDAHGRTISEMVKQREEVVKLKNKLKKHITELKNKLKVKAN